MASCQSRAVVEIDGVLDDVALAIEVGKDVDRRIGDEHRIGVGGHIHDEDMADAPVGAQPADLCGHGPHDFVGMQAALHQHFALARRGSARRPWPRQPPPWAAVSTIS